MDVEKTAFDVNFIQALHTEVYHYALPRALKKKEKEL
jgi:acetate kinase